MEEKFIRGTGLLTKQNIASLIKQMEKRESVKFSKDLVNAFYLYNGCVFKKPLTAKTVVKEYEFKSLLPFDVYHPGRDSIQTVNQNAKKYVYNHGYAIARDEKGNLLFYLYLAEGMEKMFVFDRKAGNIYQVLNTLECLKVFERPKYTLEQVEKMCGTVYDSKTCINAVREYELFHAGTLYLMIIAPFHDQVKLKPEKFLHFLNNPVDAEAYAASCWNNKYR